MKRSHPNSVANRAQGHTLLELMVAIVIGMILVLAAFSVMATFEGNKRSTTAMNDALQSGNLGLYEVDKMIRSSGTGIAKYGSLGTYGCPLNFTTAAGALITGGSIVPPTPFSNILGGAATPVPMRLAPAIIFPSATVVPSGTGSATTASDDLMLMLGGAGYAESPIPVTQVTPAGPTVQSTVGFQAGEWVLVGGSATADCMVTTVAAGYAYDGSNVVLPLTNVALGNVVMATNDFVVPLGIGPAASFMLYGVGDDSSLYSWDILNGSASQEVSADIVLMKAVYGVDRTGAGTLTWINPVATANVDGNIVDYSPAGLLAGTAAAAQSIASIKAIRVAMIIRSPLLEKNNTNLNFGTYDLFASAPYNGAPNNPVHTTWTVPDSATYPYRYREIETTISVRNNKQI